ncbi:MAG: pimeloyl-ACP methyl ester carboxylesterase [Paracoccaceae bacterium]|jgi:pimeloyl-ACP methyl ester carboxylesterase
MSGMTDFVARVVAQIGAPVHLVGHSYGGLNVLAAALSGRVKPLSLITFEANPIYAQPETGEFSWSQSMLEMAAGFETAYASNDLDAAGIIIDFWGGAGTFKNMPAQFQDYCRSVVYTNILDS